jgi:hypothetical protein
MQQQAPVEKPVSANQEITKRPVGPDVRNRKRRRLCDTYDQQTEKQPVGSFVVGKEKQKKH